MARDVHENMRGGRRREEEEVVEAEERWKRR
jgi:hypothetical protein